jgi:alkylresorcinol/alkylpyrone synthase
VDNGTANHQPPATIAATATAVPEFKITREEVKRYLQAVFSLDEMRLNAMLSIVDNSQIKQRFIIFPVEHIIQPRPLSQVTREYQEHAIRLGRQVASDCLARAGMEPKDIDLLITVSCTGVIIPSLDAYLINDLGFRSDVRRLPITELGCAAGAAALSHARQFIRAFPGSNVLVLAVEIPSMTFQRGDLNQANLISAVLFGDGAAAAVVKGASGPGPQILDAHTHTFPNTTDAMGFDLKETGFHIILSRDVPDLIRAHIRGLLDAFLGRNGLTQEKIGAYFMHPGGQKLLHYMQEELGLCECDTEVSWDVLREYGNLSSASVLFVLHERLSKQPPQPGEYGLLAAFGPGFTAEMLLLQWA